MANGCASIAKILGSMKRGGVVGSQSVGDDDEMLHRTAATLGRSFPTARLVSLEAA
jgi:hypothetical protein